MNIRRYHRRRLMLAATLLCFWGSPGSAEISAINQAQQAKREVVAKQKLSAAQTSQVQALRAFSIAEPKNRYIVQGKDASVASYRGEVEGLVATSPNGAAKLDLSDGDVQAYQAHLQQNQNALQNAIEVELGRSVDRLLSFKLALNAIVVELTEAEATQLGRVSGIKRIQKDELRFIEDTGAKYQAFAAPIDGADASVNQYWWLWLVAGLGLSGVLLLLMKRSLLSRRSALTTSLLALMGFGLAGCYEGGFEWIGAPEVWHGVGDLPGHRGEGVVVGIIDTGINPVSSSFAAVGGDGYAHINPKGKYFGVCDPAEPVFDASFPCNDKLIGAWGTSLLDGGSPRDVDGHGSHTGGTTAGNFVYDATVVTPNGKTMTKDIAGVAPHANVIAYKVCGPAGCFLVSIIEAIEQAIADGVDVINYSIGGGSSDPWADFDSLSFLSAMDAGIFVATSAGNSGPAFATLGSPADAPWITAVAASSHNIQYENWLKKFRGGQKSKRPRKILGHSVTVGYGPAPVVDAVDYGNPGCLPGLFNAPFNGEIVLCEDPDTFSRFERGQAVLDNGGGGMILYIPATSPDGIGYLMTDSHALPATHIMHTDALRIREWLATGSNHRVEIEGTYKQERNREADILAYFSSRGVDPAVNNVVKPNITAPGRAVFAAYHEDYSPAADDFNIIRGTSMSSPHIAGVGALLTGLHPSWTPMQIQSAIMTTATQRKQFKEDASTRADIFDIGAGRVDVPMAAQAGLLLDETTLGFLIQDPFFGGDPASLNLTGLGEDACVVNCSWTRTVTNTLDVPSKWRARNVAGVTVSPETFYLAPGASQQLSITFDVSAAAIGEWQFSNVRLRDLFHHAPDAHLPITALPKASNFPFGITITTPSESGAGALGGMRALEITDGVVSQTGLAQGVVTENTLVSDPTNGNPFDGFADPTVDGAFFFTVDVPVGATRLITEITESTSGDLDLFVGVGDVPGFATLLAFGTTGSFAEYININNPAPGTYWILVQNWEGGHVTPQAMKMFHAVVGADEGNYLATIPSAQAGGVEFDLGVAWNLPGSLPGDRYYGIFDAGTDPGNPNNLGTVIVDLIRN